MIFEYFVFSTVYIQNVFSGVHPRVSKLSDTMVVVVIMLFKYIYKYKTKQINNRPGVSFL